MFYDIYLGKRRDQVRNFSPQKSKTEICFRRSTIKCNKVFQKESLPNFLLPERRD